MIDLRYYLSYISYVQDAEETEGNDVQPGGGNGNLPQFHGVRMIDWNGIQIPFNEITDFENEFFKGQVLFMVKTDPEDPRYVAHFAGKQRLFEMQIQGKFKKLPEGKRMLGYVCPTRDICLDYLMPPLAPLPLSFINHSFIKQAFFTWEPS